MIAFATFLLGLVVGEVRLDLLVADSVSAVELRLDGRLCERREQPPWSMVCDLGSELAPHRLVAIALDANGAEVGRAEQLLNVHRGDAALSLVLDRDPASGRSVLQIAASSAAASGPREVVVSIDGIEVPIRDPSLVELPELDLAQPHLLRVEARWTDRVGAAIDAVVGGEHGTQLATELTAVPITVPRKRRGVPAASELAGAIRSGGRALPIAAVERGPGALWVVADPRVLPLLARRVPSSAGSRRIGGIDWRQIGVLGHGHDLRLVWPWPERRLVDGQAHDLFPPSPAMPVHSAGIPWLLYHARMPPLGEGPPHLVDATAVAGMALAATDTRRAILVLLDDRPSDEGQLSPATVRHYLERMRVPLFVWRLRPWRQPRPDPWGSTRRIASGREMLLALDELMASLHEQRIVWVRGSYLSTEIEVVDSDDLLAELARTNDERASPEATGPVPASTDAAATDEARRRSRASRLAALEAALGGGHRGSAAGVELRLARDLPLGLDPFSRMVELGVSRWRRETTVDLPSLDGTVLAIVDRFADHPELERQIAGLDARGHAGYGVAVLEAHGRPEDDVESLVLHELAHLLSERAFARPLPVWLEEGLAEHLARRTLPASDSLARRRGEIVVETDTRGVATHARGPLADLLALVRADERGELIPLERWTALSWREFVEPERRARHYALAGEFVAFLLAGETARGERFRSLLERAHAVAEFDLPGALAAELGDAQALDAEFRRWLRSERDRVLAAAGVPSGSS